MICPNPLVIAVLLCLGGAATAGELAYTCDVSHVYSLKEIGSLETSPESGVEKLMKKKSFTISRETGAVTGKTTNLDTSAAKSTQVIHRGSNENSFVAVADFGAFASGTHPYQVIKVEEFLKGAEKPFIALGDAGIVTGTCK